MMVPRGKMLGGTSGINYMAYVRGHPGDFDAWAAGGAQGWSYEEVLPYFLKAEGFVHSTELHPDLDAHGIDGPVGVSVREPVLPASTQFVEAAGSTGPQAGRLQRSRPSRAAGCRLVVPDDDPRRKAQLAPSTPTWSP